MTALRLVKRKRGSLMSGVALCDCCGREEGKRVRSATHTAHIIGYPAACLCDRCAKAWQKMWGGAL